MIKMLLLHYLNYAIDEHKYFLSKGIPLEMGQPGWSGSLRVAGLYMSGVLLGSVGASCIQPSMFLVGASAGVYSLIAAHLGKYSLIGFLDIGKQTNNSKVVFFDISIYF